MDRTCCVHDVIIVHCELLLYNEAKRMKEHNVSKNNHDHKKLKVITIEYKHQQAPQKESQEVVRREDDAYCYRRHEELLLLLLLRRVRLMASSSCLDGEERKIACLQRMMKMSDKDAA